MDDQEFKLFQDEMKGVKKIQVKNKVDLKSSQKRDASTQERRLNAERQNLSEDNDLTTSQVEMVHPLDILSFKRDGLAHGVFRKFKQGKYPMDARLDLHQKKLEQARRDVHQFIQDCMRYDVRSAIILHGKGERSETPALLKSYCNKWLREISDVMAFHSAQKQHGGVGAVYVLMKKSEKKKEENRQKYMK